jgi:UDP-N-acetylmuramate dehydrogenase
VTPAATRRDPALDEVAARLGARARRRVPLAPYCTYRVGGPAAVFVSASGPEDLAALRRALVGTGVPVLVVGRGSNLLVADAGFDGVAVHLSDAFAQVRIDGVTVQAGGAVLLPVLARRTAAAGLTGFEWAVGVPGSVGGAVRMNAGGHGSDVAASLVAAEVVDLEGPEADGPRRWTADRLALGHRRSALASGQVVVGAQLALEPGDATEAEARIAEIVRWRRANQPGGQNAGSVFANPAGDSAGRLVDAAGLKGQRLGTAEVSPRHANFIQVDPEGSADDVAALMRLVQERVRDRFGVLLRPENHLIGFEPGQGPIREPER